MSIIDPNTIPSHHLHRAILSVVAPRPIAFASTIDKLGNANLSPFSCFNAFGVNPSTLIFSPSRSGRTNELKDTYLNVKEVPEVVINIVTYSMVEQMNLASTEFPRGINEFFKSGFTPVPSEKVKPFRVKESPVQIECKVRQVIETGTGAGAANLVICEVLLIHVNDKVLDKKGMIETRKLDLVGRMGADYYVRASGRALFTLEKPVSKLAIGVDSLPEDVRMSTILTGNDLGRLGSLQLMPTAPEIKKFIVSPVFRTFITKNSDNTPKIQDEAHKLAHTMIAGDQIYEALLLLLAVNDLSVNDL
ncbi:MAG: flavin reductase family protein [Lentimicrobiaceae bacterium]